MFNLGFDQSFITLAISLFIYGLALIGIILLFCRFVLKCKITKTIVYICLLCMALGYFITVLIMGFVELKYKRTQVFSEQVEGLTIDDYVDTSKLIKPTQPEEEYVDYEDTGFQQMVEESIKIKNNK